MSFDTQGNLSYMGVVPATPPQMEKHNRAPLPSDFTYPLGTFWMQIDTENLWILVSTSLNNIPTLGDRAWWVEIGTGGAGVNIFQTNTNAASPINNTLNVYGGSNITTNAIIGASNTINIDLNTNVVIAGSLKLDSYAQGVMQVDDLGFVYTNNGTDGQILIAGAVGTNPIWANIIAGTPNVTIGNAPNSITISVAGGGGGGFNGLVADDTLTAAPDGTDLIYVVGDGTLIKTDASVANTVTFNVVPGLDAQVIGGITGSPAVWKTILSPLGSISVNSTATEIQLESVGSGAVGKLTGDAGPGAVPDMATAIKITGAGGMLTTDAGTTGANEVYIDIVDPVVDGQLIISSATGMPIWASLTAGANITIIPGPNTITISATGGGGTGGASTFPTNSGVANSTVGNTLYVYGGTNTHSLAQTTLNPNDTVVVDLNQVIYWPNTNAGSSTGVIFLGGSRYLHNYGTNNTWYGSLAGNMTLTVGSAVNNVGIGTNAYTGISSGHHDSVAVGYNAMSTVVSSSTSYNVAVGSGSLSRGGATGNTAVGYNTLNQIGISSTNNVAIGYASLAAVGSGTKNASENTAVGSRTLAAATETWWQTAVGYSALGSGVLTFYAGKGNVAVGCYAGRTCIGHGNVFIGSSAGTTHTEPTGGTLTTGSDNVLINGANNYTGAESGNIIISNPGVVGESNTTRIGGVTYGSTATYVSGIYGKTVGATNAIVYVDNTGKLGTGSATYLPAFLGILGTAVPNCVGDGTTRYYLGTTSTFSTEYDIGGNFYPGSGAGAKATFTAPFKGLYFLEVTVLLYNIPVAPPVPPPPPVVVGVDPVYIDIRTSAGVLRLSYRNVIPQIEYQPTGQQTIWYSVVAQMNATDIADFSIMTLGPGTPIVKTMGIAGSSGSSNVNTSIGGYLIGILP